MDTSSAEYRAEALRLILFAERTEWAAKHGKLNLQNKALIADEVNKTATYAQEFKDSEVNRTKDAGTSLVNAKRQLDRHTGKTSSQKALESESKAGNVDPGQDGGRQRHGAIAGEKQRNSAISFHVEPSKKVSNDSGAQAVATSVNPGKMDLIASAQNSTHLIKTLLGGYDTYTLPHPGLAQRPDLLGAQTPYGDTSIGPWTSSRVIPGANTPDNPSYNVSNLTANASDCYNILLQSNSNYNNGYVTGSNNFPNGTLRRDLCGQPSNAVYSEQGSSAFKAPVPVVKNQTLPKFKQSQKAKSKQVSELSRHGNAQTALRPENLIDRDKVRKKKPKSLKRMNSIAKKYKL